jgi:hypothetical protein
MLNDLLKNKIESGARHFADLPEVVFFDEFYDHTEKLEGAEINEFTMDGVVEMWLEFEFRGQNFFVGNQFGDYWFLVENPECPEEILIEVASHYRELTER